MRESTEDTTTCRSRPLPKDRGESQSARCVRDNPMKLRILGYASIALLACAAITPALAGEDDPKSKSVAPKIAEASGKPTKKAIWSYPSYSQARTSVAAALEEMKLPEAMIQNAMRPWPESEIGPEPSLWLDALAQSLRTASPELNELVDRALAPRKSLTVPAFALIDEQPVPQFVKNHVRLLAGRWLAQHEYYDEALEMLEGLDPNALIDPAAFLFHSAAANHQLLRKEECLTAVAKLLENESSIPGRYRSLAQLMQADLQPLEADSLDETSRLMESIERRLGHGRAGKRVRDEEDAVVAKLDKLIEDLEKQREEQQKQQQSGGSSSAPPSKPMQDSQAAGGKGPGNVDPKKLSSLGAWGNIPPKQRQEALQQLGRDLPAHYREVVEEYFRKLASEEKAPK